MGYCMTSRWYRVDAWLWQLGRYPDVTCNLQPVDGVELILVEQRRYDDLEDDVRMQISPKPPRVIHASWVHLQHYYLLSYRTLTLGITLYTSELGTCFRVLVQLPTSRRLIEMTHARDSVEPLISRQAVKSADPAWTRRSTSSLKNEQGQRLPKLYAHY